VEAVAVDPLYALPSPEIEQCCLEDLDLSLEHIGQSDALRADFDLAAYRRSKLKTLEEFLADRLADPESYQTASLPNLTFDSGSFDLVVCGHPLFSYAPVSDGGLFPTVEPLLTQLPTRWAGQLTTTAYDQGFEGATPLLLLERGGPDRT
jgi:xanthine/CO dehydrogenase XdhC/CoxF family maturation factor